MTLRSAEEFVSLRYSADPADHRRAATEDAALSVWRDVMERYPDAKVWVAHNKTVPLEILADLSLDASVEVRHMVAMKRKLTPEILDHLAADDDESVRMRVAMHKNVTDVTLQRLRDDSWDQIRKLVAERLADER